MRIAFVLLAAAPILQAHAEESLPSIIAIAAGGSAFLRADGSVWAFTDPNALTSPVKVIGLKDIVQIAVVDDGSVGYALRRDGTVWSWRARYSYPDDSTVLCRYGQVRQIRGIADVVQLAAGRAFAIALKGDGTVWGWGDDTVGQLGDTVAQLKIGLGRRDFLERSHPTRIHAPIQIPVLKDIVRISASLDHTIALDRNGQAWSWGGNAADNFGLGILGEGEFVSRAGVGVIKLNKLPPSSDVAAGSSRMAVLGRDGKLRAWGLYRDGVVQYGDMAVSEVDGAENPQRIAAGCGAVFWIGDDGVAWQQGPGMFGYDRKDPGRTMRVGLDGPISQISPGDFKISVLTAHGQIWSWGSNNLITGTDIADPVLVTDH
jgi:alpha-tubulin suppressor-like RCC1 family protein